jgi:hypothetical protein
VDEDDWFARTLLDVLQANTVDLNLAGPDPENPCHFLVACCFFRYRVAHFFIPQSVPHERESQDDVQFPSGGCGSLKTYANIGLIA